jgi:type IV fimbrial biogenesis protein FimT
MRQDEGVTLIEACVVMAVCTVLLATAVPAMRRMIERQMLRGAADGLRTDLQFLRTAAVSRGRTLWLGTQGGNGSCYVLYAGGRGDCSCRPAGAAACAAGAEVLKVVGFEPDAAVQLPAGNTLLAVEPERGMVTPTATLKLVGRGGEAVHTLVNVMGRVRACSPGAAVPGFKAC